MRRSILSAALAAVVVLLAAPAAAQQTVGLFRHDPGTQPGLNLFGVLSGTQIFLIDNDGRVINEWVSAYPSGNTVYLTESGDLYRCGRFQPAAVNRFGAGGQGGVIQRFSWDGTLEWEFVYSDDQKRHHHDIEILPNGNILMIAWELRSQSEAIANGRDPALLNVVDENGELWPDTIIEIEPSGTSGGTIVWEWRAWDHLIQDFDPTKANFGVVADHPELIDLNWAPRGARADWLHANAVDYLPAFDQIVISLPFVDEFWVIDHSTTTAEAAGHTGGTYGKGGDLLYRWGNPQAYRRGTAADQQSFNQHDVNWIDPGLPGAGNIIFFNNRNVGPQGNFSTITEIVPPYDAAGVYPALAPGEAHGPAAPTYVYTADPPESLFSGGLSSARRLANGNTLFDEGQTGTFTEVLPTGETVWNYVNPVAIAGPLTQGATPTQNRAFRVTRYPLDFPGFVGKDLTPGDLLEIYTKPIGVPTGSLRAERTTLAGDALRVEFDTTPCAAESYNLLYGSLGNVATLAMNGAECGLGTTGAHDWLAVPGGDLWFLVVGADSTGVYESSWGAGAGGAERNGLTASQQCGATNKVLDGACP